MINHGVNQHTKTVSGFQKDSNTVFFLPSLSFGAFLPLWRISGSTTWIWRKRTRNKDLTGGSNTSWLRLLDWLTCGHKACSSWAWASGCRRPKPSTSISVTSWSATTVASSARETVRSTRCVLCSTWTSCPTPNASRMENGSVNEHLVFNNPRLFFLLCWNTECYALVPFLDLRYFLVSKV